jgi:signal transduction histidine kinase
VTTRVKPADGPEAAAAAPASAEAPSWALLDAMPDLAVLVRNDAIYYVNRPGMKVIGGTAAENIVGQRLDRFFDARTIHEALLVGAKSGPEPAWHRSRIKRLDGTQADVEVRAVPLTAQRMLAVVARTIDLSEILSDEKSTDAHATDGMQQLVASMAHELRTPLNAIIGFSEILTEQMFGEINARYVSYAEDIAASGQHLLRIINDILDYAKVEAGEMTLRLESVSLADVIRASLRLVAGQADRAGVALTEELGGPLPTVKVDPTKIKQVLVNLLMNAVKFTPRGGRVIVRLAPGPAGHVRITVGDTGIGMTEAEAAEAILPFRQPKRPPDGGYAGTGLGLPIAKALAALHGGTLRIASAPDKGTEVTVTLPAKSAS